MAVAVEADGRYVCSYGNRYSNVDGAVDRALDECDQARANHEISARCEVYMVNGEPQS